MMPASHQARYASFSSLSSPSAYLHRIHTYLTTTYRAFFALRPEQRYIIYFAFGIKLLILSIVLYVGPESMFNATAQLAIWFGTRTYGAVLLMLVVVVVSFPPLVGYGTSITLFGLGWGVRAAATAEHAELRGNLLHAWVLASLACLLGGSVAFGVLRFLIVHHAKRVSWISATLNDAKYVALSTAVRRRGLSMAILIRFCPFPFAYSNLFFASLVDAVSFRQFLVATALITPKLFLHVWLGTRMFQLMDRGQRAQLDGWAKTLNVVYILVGSAVGVATGWVVWSETSKVLDAIEREQQDGIGPRSTGSGGADGVQRRGMAERQYSDDDARKRSSTDATSPFIVDVDEDVDGADEDHGRRGSGSSSTRKEHATKSLLPR